MSADPNYTSIGIFISLAGNTVISLSLNLQKLAHKRVNEAATAAGNGSGSATQTPSLSRQASSNSTLNQDHHELAEQRPLLPHSTPTNAYGTSKPRTWWISLRKQSPRQVPQSPQAANGDLEQEHEDDDDEIDEVPRGETDYLYSKLWWLGFLLMNVGELGNFLSYAYAPASLVAPLGAVALVANCFFAPLILGERFRKRDLIGIFLAIIGTVTIVLSSKPTDVRLDKDGLIRAISQPIFIGYTIFTICAILFLTILSQGNAGREWIFIDVGICALYGGYTVLATKGLSTLLSLRLIEVYKIWLTYPLIVVLLGTGIGQIRYLNRALMKFDSKHVIPTNFTLFTLSALCGSAILYRDFENVSLHRMISFLYGIITVFAAIFLLTYTAPVSSGTPLVTLDDPISVITSPISPSTDGTQGHHAAAMSINGNKYVLRTKSSTANLGISPGQYLLIAASPPNNEGAQRIARDVERDFGSTRARRGRSYAQDNDRSRSRSRDGRRRTIHFEDASSNGR